MDEKQKQDYMHSFTGFGRLCSGLYLLNSRRGDVQPAAEPEIGRFLEFLIRLTGARRVLELGTSNGISALWMAEGLRHTGGSLVTVDSKERLHLEAVENFREAGCSDIITAVLGDAEEVLAGMTGGFDLVFQDCGKYLYPVLYERIFGLLSPGGIIVADDTMFSTDSSVRPGLGKYTDEYNRMVFADERMFSTILPAGHGITLSMKLN